MRAKAITEEDLKPDELIFIQHHGISIDQVLDVRGMIQVGEKRALEARDARIAISSRPCRRQHRLKTRSGHCPMCDPSDLAYEKRHSETALVYVCVSEKGLVKIGYTKDLSDRVKRLNRERFASCSMWRDIFSIETRTAGKVEQKAQSYLWHYLTFDTYDKSGDLKTSREVFSCTEAQAIEAIYRARKTLNL